MSTSVAFVRGFVVQSGYAVSKYAALESKCDEGFKLPILRMMLSDHVRPGPVGSSEIVSLYCQDNHPLHEVARRMGDVQSNGNI